MKVLIILLLSTVGAWGQAWTPPFCTGPNAALQYDAKGWICATITGTAVPAQPPASECITSHWDGTKWTCVPTNYLTSEQTVPLPPARRSLRATDTNGCEWTLTGPGPVSVVSQWQQVDPNNPNCK